MNTTTTSDAERAEAAAAPQPRHLIDSSPGEMRGCEEGAAVLETKLGLLLEGIGAGDVRELVCEVFTYVSRLLGYVCEARGELERNEASEAVPPLLRKVRVESRHLLTVIETGELRVEELGDGLRQTFDSVAFAMGHELRRVYEVELVALDGGAAETRISPASAVRACGLFENCFQQAVITLAQAFDPTVTGVSIFEDYKERREQSLCLRAELSLLVGKVKQWRIGDGLLGNVSVLRQVRRFRYQYMHLLMYRDWEEFERFTDALEERYESPDEFATAIHSFACYLETLHQHVSLRSVLADA